MASHSHSAQDASSQQAASKPPAAAPMPQKYGTRVNLSSNAIAGVAAGFSSSVITHPLDVVKTRFQVRVMCGTSVPRMSPPRAVVTPCLCIDVLLPHVSCNARMPGVRRAGHVFEPLVVRVGRRCTTGLKHTCQSTATPHTPSYRSCAPRAFTRSMPDCRPTSWGRLSRGDPTSTATTCCGVLHARKSACLISKDSWDLW
jgi:hypothetical protein